MSPNTKKKKKISPREKAAKQEKKNKMIMYGFIGTAVVIVGLIVYAILYSTVLKDNIPVAVVNGEEIGNGYFQSYVRLMRNSYIEYYHSVDQMYQSLGDYPDQQQNFQQQLVQIEQSLDTPTYIGEIVLNNTIDDKIIELKGRELGIEISDAEIEKVLQEFYNYYPEGTPTPEALPTAVATPTWGPTQEAILDIPVPSALDLELDEAVEVTAEEEAVDEPTEETLEEPTAEPTATTVQPTVTPSITPTPYTKDLYEALYSEYLETLNNIEVPEEHWREYIYNFLMKQKVREAIVADVPVEEEQIWARHILVGTVEEAVEVLERLKEEKWNFVAADVSLDTANKDFGGDLEWFARGQMVEAFEVAAFALEVGEMSVPVETQFGWHIIQLVDRAEFPVNANDYEIKRNEAYDAWFAEAKEEADIKINDVWRDLTPIDPDIEDVPPLPTLTPESVE